MSKCSGYGIMKKKCCNEYTTHAPYYCLGCYEHFHADLKIKHSEQQLKEAEKVIEFYVGESNWIYGVEITQEDHDISEETREGFVKEQGGKKAREYKSKYKVDEK